MFSQFCIKDGGQQGYRVILETVLTVLSRLISDRQPEVRVSAGEALVAVSQHVRRKDLGPYVLTIVLQVVNRVYRKIRVYFEFNTNE